MFPQSDNLSWLDPHLVLPGGSLWEDDAEDNAAAATVVASTSYGLDTTSTQPLAKRRFTVALEKLRETALSDTLSSCPENSRATSEVLQQLRQPARLTRPAHVGGSASFGHGHSPVGNDAATPLEDDDGTLLGALRGNGLLHLLADDPDDVTASSNAFSRHGASLASSPLTAHPGASDLFAHIDAPVGGSVAQRQARQEAQQRAEMAAAFHSVPRQLGVREAPVLCPLDPHEHAITHVATGNGVFALVTAEMPQRMYLFDQLNDVLITCLTLGGETFPAPANTLWRPYTVSSSSSPVEAEVRCGVEACTIDRDDRVRALFMNPTGHVCLVTMESNQALYVYIPHKPSDVENSRGSAEAAGASGGGDEQFLSGGSSREAAHMPSSDRGTKAWRRAAQRWLRFGHRIKSERTSASLDGGEHDAETDGDEVAHDTPTVFSFTLTVRHHTSPSSPVTGPAASAVSATAATSTGTTTTTTTGGVEGENTTGSAAATMTNPLGGTRPTAASSSVVPIESVGWGCAEDAEVLDTGLEVLAPHRGSAPLVSVIIGTRRGGLVLAGQFAGSLGLAALGVIYRFPLETHLATAHHEVATDSLASTFPMEAVDVFWARVPLADADRDEATSSPRPATRVPSRRTSRSVFPEYTHTPHFLAADQYEQSAAFQVASTAEESRTAALPDRSAQTTDATSPTPARPSLFAVRATVLLAAKNRLYVFSSDRHTLPAASPLAAALFSDGGRHNEAEVRDNSARFMALMHAAFQPMCSGGETALASSFVALPTTTASALSTTTLTAVPSAAVTVVEAIPAPPPHSRANQHDEACGFARHARARSSLQLLSPHALFHAIEDAQGNTKAHGRVKTPEALAATLPPTFYWQYNGWLVQGMILTTRVNAWERLTETESAAVPSATASAAANAPSIQDAWTARLHQRTRRAIERELLADEEAPAGNRADTAHEGQPRTQDAATAPVLLPIGILAVRNVQDCLDGLTELGSTHSVPADREVTPSLHDDDADDTDADRTVGEWPPLHPSLVRGEMTEAGLHAIQALRRRLRDPPTTSPPTSSAAAAERPAPPSSQPAHRSSSVKSAPAAPHATGDTGVVVSVSCSYDHVLVTTTRGVFAFFHLSALALPSHPVAWRRQLLLHTQWAAPSAASASPTPPLFRVTTDSRPGPTFYCLSSLSIAALTMQHSLADKDTLRFHHHVSQLLDEAAAAAKARPPASHRRPSHATEDTAPPRPAPRAAGKGTQPDDTRAATVAGKRLAILTGLAQEAAPRPSAPSTREAHRRAILETALHFAEHDGNTQGAALPAAWPALMRGNPLLALLDAHVLASRTHTPRQALSYALTVPFMGTTAGVLPVSVADAEAAARLLPTGANPVVRGGGRDGARVLDTAAVYFFLSPRPELWSRAASNPCEGDHHAYYACAPDYAYEMALQLALAAASANASIDNPGDEGRRAALAMCGDVRHAYGCFLWNRGRALEAAAQLAHPGPIPLDTLLPHFIQRACGGRAKTVALPHRHRHSAGDDEVLLFTTENIATRQLGTRRLAVAATSLDPLVLLLRVRLASYERSFKGTPAHRIKVSAVASLLVTLLAEHANHRDAARLSAVLSSPDDAPPATPSAGPTCASRAGFLRWKYHLDSPDALLHDVALRYGAALPWSLVSRTAREVAAPRRAVWLAGALGRPVEACEALLLRQQHVLEGLLCLERLTRANTELGVDEPTGNNHKSTEQHLGKEEVRASARAVGQLLPFPTDSDVASGLAAVSMTAPVPLVESSSRSRRTSTSHETKPAGDAHTQWLSALGVAVAKEVMHATAANLPALDDRTTGARTPTVTSPSNEYVAATSLSSAQAVLYTSGLLDHSFPLLLDDDGVNNNAARRARRDLLTLLHASASTVGVPSTPPHCSEEVIDPARSRPSPAEAGSGAGGAHLSTAGAPTDDHRFRLRKWFSDGHDLATTTATTEAAAATGASGACVPAAVISSLWQRFAPLLVRFYPYRVLLRGVCGSLARAVLPFAGERLIPALLTYTPHQNEPCLVAGVRDGCACATTPGCVEEVPLTADGVMSMLALVWGSRTLQRAWQREASAAQTRRWMHDAVAHASLESSMTPAKASWRPRTHSATLSTTLDGSPATAPADSDIRLSSEKEDGRSDGSEDDEMTASAAWRTRTPARRLRFSVSREPGTEAGPDGADDIVGVRDDSSGSEHISASGTSIGDDDAHVSSSTFSIQHRAQTTLLQRVGAPDADGGAEAATAVDAPGRQKNRSVTAPGHVAVQFLLALARDKHLANQLWPDPLMAATTSATATDAAAAAAAAATSGSPLGVERLSSWASGGGGWPDGEPSRRELGARDVTSPRRQTSLWLTLGHLVACDADEATMDAFMTLLATRYDAVRWRTRSSGLDETPNQRAVRDNEVGWWASAVLSPLFRFFAHHNRRRGCAWVYHLLGHHHDALRLLLQEARHQVTLGSEPSTEDTLPESLELLIRFIQEAGNEARRRVERDEADATARAHTQGTTSAAVAANALNPDEVARHARRELWLTALKQLLAEPDRHATLALMLVKHSQHDVDVTDILPYVDPQAPMATFKDALYASLKNVSASLERSKRLFGAAMSDLAVLQDDTQLIAHRPLHLRGESQCMLCHSAAVQRPFVLFRNCAHVCHMTCYRDARRRLDALARRDEAVHHDGFARSASASSSAVTASRASPTRSGSLLRFDNPHSPLVASPSDADNNLRMDEDSDTAMENLECLWCGPAYVSVFLTAPLSVPLFTDEKGTLPADVLNLL